MLVKICIFLLYIFPVNNFSIDPLFVFVCVRVHARMGRGDDRHINL